MKAAVYTENDANARFEKLDNKDAKANLCTQFTEVIEDTATVNDSAIFISMREQMYDPLAKTAGEYCKQYDEMRKQNAPKEEIENATKTAANAMFEDAFKCLGIIRDKTLTKIVDGNKVTETTKVPVFAIRTLKEQIIAAQKIADIMMAKRTPVGFYKGELADFAKGYNVLENTEHVRDFLKQTCGNQYSEKLIDRALKEAKNEFGVLYRDEKLDMSYVYSVGYRPNPARMNEEGLAINAVHLLVSKDKNQKRAIEDESLRAIVNESVRRWKTMNKVLKKHTNVNFDKVAQEATWKSFDQQFCDTYKDYDVDAMQGVIADATEKRHQEKKNIEVNLKDPTAKTVPPVEVKPPVAGMPPVEKK